MRLHIAILGRRNAGKSSLLNALAHQQVSIVSEIAGTTTDPVDKPMELQPLGPVVLMDTAGIDDEGTLGTMRVERTIKVLDRTDVALLVCAAGNWTNDESELLGLLKARNIPTIIVFNKTDVQKPEIKLIETLKAGNNQVVETCSLTGEGVMAIRDALIQVVPEDFIRPQSILGELAKTDAPIVLVTPIDKEAPKGRLILPQVQTIRDILDNEAWCVVTTEKTLPQVLRSMKDKPALVVTDSQAFKAVDAMVPADIPLTSFSILFARFKGNLQSFVNGARHISSLQPNDRILIAEACTHHPIEEDIGTVKIPRLLQQKVGGELRIEHVRGCDFPQDLSPYQLVIHCGACVWNRRAMLSRILECERQGVPITNYGTCIAAALGILDRAVAVFHVE